jgi:hypothetical protein
MIPKPCSPDGKCRLTDQVVINVEMDLTKCLGRGKRLGPFCRGEVLKLQMGNGMA